MDSDGSPSKKRRVALMHLTDLPDDILSLILVGVPLHELYWTIVLVCRRFHDIVMTNSAFTETLSTILSTVFPDSGVAQTTVPAELVESVKVLLQNLYDPIGQSPTFEFIMKKLHSTYPNHKNPMSHTAMIKFWMGGPDPIDYVYFFPNIDESNGRPFWHYVSVGMTQKLNDDSVASFPYEFSLRLYVDEIGTGGGYRPLAPVWPVVMMQAFARYNFRTGNAFEDGDYTNAPIGNYANVDSCLFDSVAFRKDPQMGELKVYALPRIVFLEMICLTPDEGRNCKMWKTSKTLNVLFGDDFVVTDLSRGCRLAGDEGKVRKDRILLGMSQEGSWCGMLPFRSSLLQIQYLADLDSVHQCRCLTITMAWPEFEQVAAVLNSRIGFHRPFDLVAGFEVSGVASFRCFEDDDVDEKTTTTQAEDQEEEEEEEEDPRFLIKPEESSEGHCVCVLNGRVTAEILRMSKRIQDGLPPSGNVDLEGSPESLRELDRYELVVESSKSRLVVIVMGLD